MRQNYALVSTNENFVVFRNDSAKPYVSATTRTCVFLGDIHQSPQLALALEAKHFTLVHDVARERLHNVEQIYEAGSLLYPPVTPSQVLPLSDVRLSRENSQLIRIIFSSPQPCVAVIAESYYPFWRAEVDGKPAEVLRVNCAIMGVEVSSGVHEIMLRYEPPRIYAVAGVVTVLGFVAGLVVATRTVYVKASRGPK